jgi:hypothetical protein
MTVKYCKICGTDTTHDKGTFKCHEVKGELFELTISSDEALKKLSDGFSDFVTDEHEGWMNSQTPPEYAMTEAGGLNLQDLFANSIRAMKCEKCGHLIKLSRLP